MVYRWWGWEGGAAVSILPYGLGDDGWEGCAAVPVWHGRGGAVQRQVVQGWPWVLQVT